MPTFPAFHFRNVDSACDAALDRDHAAAECADQPRPECEQHWIPYTGIADSECVLCIAHELFRDERGAIHSDWDEHEAAFKPWLLDALQVANFSDSALHSVLRKIKEAPGELLERWRWERQPEAARMSIKISVCSWCGGYIGYEKHYGKNASEGEAAYESHGKCDRCLEKDEQAALAAEREVA